MTLVRVGGHQGKWHRKECAFEDKWIKGQVRDKGKATGTKISSIIKAADGKVPVWQKFRHCIFKSGHWRETSRIPLDPMSVVLWASGREKDGLVHFFAWQMHPKAPSHQSFTVDPFSPVSCPLVPSFLFANPLFLGPNVPFCFPLSVLRYTEDHLAIGSQPKLYLWNKVCCIHLTRLSFSVKGLKSLFRALACTTADTSAFIRFESQLHSKPAGCVSWLFI